MKKRLLAIIATVAMVVAMMPSMVFGATEVDTLDELQDALANDSVTEITVTDTIVVDKEVTIDLAGKKISMIKSETITGNHEMINVDKGKLTINDSVGGGSIIYQYTGADTYDSVAQNGYATNTITNSQGAVIVNGGTIVNNTTSNRISYVIDNRTNDTLGDATLEVAGGTLTCARTVAIRAYANSTSCMNKMSISGGEINGAVQVQQANPSAHKAELNISGDTKITSDYCGVFLNAKGDASKITINISGGTINAENATYGAVNLNNTTNGGSAFDCKVTEGTFNGDVWIYSKGDDGAYIYPEVISGGTFTGYVYEGLLVENKQFDDEGNVVCAHEDSEEIGEVAPTCKEPGNKAGVICKDCGEYVEGGEVIPATGVHTYKDGVCTVCGEKAAAPAAKPEKSPETGDNSVAPFAVAGLILAAMAAAAVARRRYN